MNELYLFSYFDDWTMHTTPFWNFGVKIFELRYIQVSSWLDNIRHSWSLPIHVHIRILRHNIFKVFAISLQSVNI